MASKVNWQSRQERDILRSIALQGLKDAIRRCSRERLPQDLQNAEAIEQSVYDKSTTAEEYQSNMGSFRNTITGYIPGNDWRSPIERDVQRGATLEGFKSTIRMCPAHHLPQDLQNAVEIEQSIFDKSNTKNEYESLMRNVHQRMRNYMNQRQSGLQHGARPPSSNSPYQQPQAGVPYQQSQARVLYQQPQARAPYKQPQAGMLDQQHLVRVPNQQPQAGVPYQQPQAGVPYQQPQVGVPYQQPQAGVPYHQPQAGVLHQQPQARVPYRQPLPKQPPEAGPHDQQPQPGTSNQQPQHDSGHVQTGSTSTVSGSKGYGGEGGSGMVTPIAPGGVSLSQRNVLSISSLNPYQNKWTIRARVSNKPSLRKWSNSRGEGTVLNVDLVDEQGEIRACGFNEVADKFHKVFEMGKVYYISRGRLRPANRNFNNLKNDYELNLTNETEVEMCLDTYPELPTLQHNVTAITDLESEEPSNLVGYREEEASKMESEADERIRKEALEEGVVKCKTMNVAVTGHAGVGKTCTLRYILNMPPPDTRDSTGAVDGPFRAASISHQATVKDCELVEVSDGNILHILLNARKKSSKSDPQIVKQSSDEDTSAVATTEAPVVDDQLGSTETKFNVEASTVEFSLDADIEKLINDLTRNLEQKTGDESKVQLFFFLDSGGQPEYREMFSSFVPNLQVGIAVVNLSEKLEEYPRTQFVKKDKLISEHESRYSNKMILENCIHTMQSISNRDQASSSGDSNLDMIVVGTHIDDPVSENNLKEINRELKSIVLQIVNEDRLVCYHSDDDIIFPINAVKRDHDRVVAAIRRRLCANMEYIEESEIPIRWFALRQILCELCKKDAKLQVVSIEHCKAIAKKLKVPDETFEPALRYLRKHNLILYYPKQRGELPEMVFCEQQTLLNPINDLVQGVYKMRGDRYCRHPEGKHVEFEALSTKKFKDIKNMGIITKEFLQQKDLESRFNSLFTPDEFLRIVTYLGIAAEITEGKSNSYIFPCLLDDLDAKEFHTYRSDSHPLLVFFNNAIPQSGTFSALIASLIEKHGWKPQEDKCAYRNCMQFNLQEKCGLISVTLIKSHEYFEVHASGSEIEKDSLRRIKQNVFSALPQKAPKSEPAFFCEVCDTDKDGPHVATLIPNEDNVQCSLTKKPESISCFSGYLRWMEDNSKALDTQENEMTPQEQRDPQPKAAALLKDEVPKPKPQSRKDDILEGEVTQGEYGEPSPKRMKLQPSERQMQPLQSDVGDSAACGGLQDGAQGLDPQYSPPQASSAQSHHQVQRQSQAYEQQQGTKRPRSEIGYNDPLKQQPNVQTATSSSDFKVTGKGFSNLIKCEKQFASSAWEIQKPTVTRTPIIAILDTGINDKHETFKQPTNTPADRRKILSAKNFVTGQDENNVFDLDGHGTACAGIAAGLPYDNFTLLKKDYKGDFLPIQTNSEFPGGVTPNAQLIICRVGERISSFNPEAICRALEYLIELNDDFQTSGNSIPYVNVVSMSFGFNDSVPQIQANIEKLKSQGTICVAAAGNDGKKGDKKFPAYLGSTISVGSHDTKDNQSSFSPDDTDAIAVGEDVLVPVHYPDCNTCLISAEGTSMAAPAVAGLIAQILACTNPDELQKVHDIDWIRQNVFKKAPMLEKGVLKPRKFFDNYLRKPNELLSELFPNEPLN